MERLKLRHALITGASSGIGRALAIALAPSGILLSLCGRDIDCLNETASRCRSLGAQADICQIDVTDQQAVEDWINRRDAVVPLDLVIANAGVGGGQGRDREESLDEARFTASVNLLGTMNTVYPALALMKSRRQGRIVLMSSLAGLYGLPQAPSYCASKSAIRSLGQSLHVLARPYGVSISLVMPGFVETAMNRDLECPKPFMIDADQAARIILDGISRNKAEIVFPASLAFAMRFLAVLPSMLSARILTLFSVSVPPPRR